MVEVIDLNQEKQTTCRIMICQLNSDEFDWELKNGLYFMINNDKISLKIKDILSIAKLNSVDLILFPELSIPEKQIEKLQEWSKEQQSIIICGSHYSNNNGKFIPRSPIIIKGEVFFTEKIFLSPLEKSPIMNQGASSGTKVLKFVNTFVGNFAVLICSDYLEENLKDELDLQSLDFLCVPSYQRDSEVYFRRMNTECENSKDGIFIIYSNFLNKKYGDGNSSLFGLMDRMYLEKIKDAGYTDLNPNKKIFQFTEMTEYLIADINLNNKRPFANRNINTSPNVHILSINTQTRSKDLEFIKKIFHDDERYKRIDELYVKPNEFDEILKIIDEKNIVFIIGDPGIGKTYTAVKILKTYYEKGFQPIWIAGLEKEERDLQSKVLRDFEPTANQIVYFEDPFGRTAFEKRDSLFQIFSPLMDKLRSSNCKIIITSRKEIFETFTKESLLEKEILEIKKELNVSNPSYDKQLLYEIFKKLSVLFCDWYSNDDFTSLVHIAIKEGRLTTPLAIRDLVFVSKNTETKELLQEQIERRTNETTKVFALEILASSITTKLVLYLTYFSGFKGKPFLSQLYQDTAKELIKLNLPITSFSFNIEMRSQIGYRIEQFGYNRTAYKFAHPIYEEALSNLITSDSTCETIAKAIIQELAKLDLKIAYNVINRFVIKNPDVSLLLINHINESNSRIEDQLLRMTLSQKLISTFYLTKNEDFFELACHFYSLKEIVTDINNHFKDWYDLEQKLNLCQRYINNSPIEFNSSLTNEIDWENAFNNKNDSYFTPNRILKLLTISTSINQNSLSIFIEKKGGNFIKKIYLLSDDNDRKRFLLLLKGHSIENEIKKYRRTIQEFEKSNGSDKFKLFRKAIFSELKYYGKITIDVGAEKALSKFWVNLLPVGIDSIEGFFTPGAIVGIFNNQDKLIAVGVTEYSSENLKKIMKHSTNQFHDLIGYYHTNCAVKSEFLKRLNNNESRKWKLVN
ncbi:PUA domain-containing protein [Flavobacterium sp. H4147]|uniref:nSTAND3 domain-containing NTPase n=1 Tax=Flavobacterium sp. H4147 TaxID=3034149 RepID=UPI0023ED2EBF|nr:PUA domain-containing protein [Flavobacterium sp. H4147]